MPLAKLGVSNEWRSPLLTPGARVGVRLGPMVDAGENARINALESRVATLEAEVRNLSSRTDRAEGKLDDHYDRIGKASERITELKKRVAHLPSRGWSLQPNLA
jgi:peptidoglycan hydrolase CwlO-like protein